MLSVEQYACTRGQTQAEHGCKVIETLPLRLFLYMILSLTRQKHIPFLKRFRCCLGSIYHFSISNRTVDGAQSRLGARVRGWRVCRGRGIGGGREGGKGGQGGFLRIDEKGEEGIREVVGPATPLLSS
jgi:hypothetical protein